MVDEKKRRRRVKGTSAGSGRVTEKAAAKRYTAPEPAKYKAPSKIIPIVTFTFFTLGVLIILLNYLPGSPVLPGDTNNQNLLIGLALICVGFGTATKLR